MCKSQGISSVPKESETRQETHFLVKENSWSQSMLCHPTPACTTGHLYITPLYITPLYRTPLSRLSSAWIPQRLKMLVCFLQLFTGRHFIRCLSFHPSLLPRLRIPLPSDILPFCISELLTGLVLSDPHRELPGNQVASPPSRCICPWTHGMCSFN